MYNNILGPMKYTQKHFVIDKLHELEASRDKIRLTYTGNGAVFYKFEDRERMIEMEYISCELNKQLELLSKLS